TSWDLAPMPGSCSPATGPRERRAGDPARAARLRAGLAVGSARPAAFDGVNWLFVGSDSRQGLSRQQEDQLVTGHDVGGMRPDTLMLLHVTGNGGPPTLISLPRDSYVPIPGHGRNKLNAAFSLGGPSLLAEAVQNLTGLRIARFAEIGF